MRAARRHPTTSDNIRLSPAPPGSPPAPPLAARLPGPGAARGRRSRRSPALGRGRAGGCRRWAAGGGPGCREGHGTASLGEGEKGRGAGGCTGSGSGFLGPPGCRVHVQRVLSGVLRSSRRVALGQSLVKTARGLVLALLGEVNAAGLYGPVSSGVALGQ